MTLVENGKEKHAKKEIFQCTTPLSSFLECCYLLWANGPQLHNGAATSALKLHTHSRTEKNAVNSFWKFIQGNSLHFRIAFPFSSI